MIVVGTCVHAPCILAPAMLFEGSYSDYILVQGCLIEKIQHKTKQYTYANAQILTTREALTLKLISLFNVVSFVCGPPSIILFSNHLLDWSGNLFLTYLFL